MDGSYVKQGIRNISSPNDLKHKEWEDIKSWSKSLESSVDQGFEVIVMRRTSLDGPKSKPHRVGDNQERSRTRGRSRTRIHQTQDWSTLLEPDENGTSSASASFTMPRSADKVSTRHLSLDKNKTPQSRKQHHHSPRQEVVVDELDLLIQSALKDKQISVSPTVSSPRRARSVSNSSRTFSQPLDDSIVSTVEKKRRSSRTRSQSRCRSMGIEEYTFSAQIVPNVHDCAITTKVINTEEIDEMNENELFARKAGLAFSTQLGDYLISSDFKDRSIQDEDHCEYFTLSPKFNADRYLYDDGNDVIPPNATFFRETTKVHPRNTVVTEQNLLNIQNIANKISVEWSGKKLVAPSVARRFVDFQFARLKRKAKYGAASPWGVLGLYEFLANVRTDVDWAEQAAKARANGEPYTAWSNFIGKQNSGINRPWVTYLFIVVCSAMFLACIGVNDWVFEQVSTNPMLGPSVSTLIKLGAKDSILIVQKYELWRLIVPMVLHAGLVHYFLNMASLWFVGAALEKAHGHLSFFTVFFVSGLGGNLASAIFLPKFISVGASGAIFGVMGACLADIFLNWSVLFSNSLNESKSIVKHGLVVFVLFLDIALNVVIGFTPLLDNFQHLTGMILGFLCGISLIKRVSTKFLGEFQHLGVFQRLKNFIRIYLGIGVSLLLIVGGIVVLMNGDGSTSPCPACSVISCIEFPPWLSPNNRWWHCDDCSAVSAVVSTPTFEMTMTCPSGWNVTVPLHDEYLNVDFLKKNLISICRDFCLN